MPGLYGISAPSYKSVALAQSLQVDLNARLPVIAALGSSLLFDSNGYSVVQFGAMVSEGQNVTVRVQPIGTWGKDIVGLTQNDYANHVMHVLVEADVETASGSAGSALSLANLLLVLGEILKFGTRVELYHTANGTVPTIANFPAGAPDAVWEAHIQYPEMASQ